METKNKLELNRPQEIIPFSDNFTHVRWSSQFLFQAVNSSQYAIMTKWQEFCVITSIKSKFLSINSLECWNFLNKSLHDLSTNYEKRNQPQKYCEKHFEPNLIVELIQ